jgi:1-acyl-sn-glycerol-3-phosphate acyltransferase
MPDCGKLVIIAAPHTSNWDFVFGMTGAFALGLELHWMGKHTLFKPPLGGVMRWLGGLAIDRRAAHGVVEQVADEFARRGQLLLVVTPEGTRSKVERWKTGFWHIARAAGVPILLGGLDYGWTRLRAQAAGVRPTARAGGIARRGHGHDPGALPWHDATPSQAVLKHFGSRIARFVACTTGSAAESWCLPAHAHVRSSGTFTVSHSATSS